MEFLDTMFYNNSVSKWLTALVTLILSFIILKVVIAFIKNRLEKIAQQTTTQIDDVIVIILKKTTSLFLMITSVLIASLFLKLTPLVSKIIFNVWIIILLIQVAVWGNALITYYISRYVTKRKETDAAAVTTVSALGFISKLILYTGLFIIALDNLGFDITTLVAGLGVGGIAIALAVQNVLGDLFASLSIVLDKPFIIGDFIIVDEHRGTVEHVGLKTTRIRSLSGEQLVFSNTDLLKSRIRNYKRMNERRVVFSVGVIYQTTQEQLAKIPAYIRQIIEQQQLVRFDRAHFKGFGNFSLDFEVVYWVKSADYNTYMDIQQTINLSIFEKFSKEKIEFAYPTQTLFIDKYEINH
jgi:small-conductance mechanosensitive channel